MNERDQDALLERRKELISLGSPLGNDPRTEQERWAKIAVVEPVETPRGYIFKPRQLPAIPIAEHIGGKTYFFPWDDLHVQEDIHPDATFYNAKVETPNLLGAKQAYRNSEPDSENPTRSIRHPEFMLGTHAATSKNGFLPKYTEPVHDTYLEALGCLRHKTLTQPGKAGRIEFMEIDYEVLTLFNALAGSLSFTQPTEPGELEKKIKRAAHLPIIREIIGEEPTQYFREKTCAELRLRTKDYSGMDASDAQKLATPLQQLKTLAIEPDKDRNTKSHMSATTDIVPNMLKFHALTHPINNYRSLLDWDGARGCYRTTTGENIRLAHEAVSGMLAYFGYKRFARDPHEKPHRVRDYLERCKEIATSLTCIHNELDKSRQY